MRILMLASQLGGRGGIQYAGRLVLRALREWATRNQPEDVVRRRPTDAVRAVVAAVLLVPLAYHAGHLWLTEQRVIEFFDSIPHGARTLFLILYQLAALWAVGLLVVTVLLLRRWRLARDLAVAGALAWVLGRLMAYFTNRSDLRNAMKVTLDLGDVPRFPMVRVTVAVAVVLVASPHLTRPGGPGARHREGMNRRLCMKVSSSCLRCSVRLTACIPLR